MAKNKKNDFTKKKEKSTFEKFIWTSGEKYRFFVWDKNISKAFTILLLILLLLLSALVHTQNQVIEDLIKKDSTSKKLSDNMYNGVVYSEVIAIDEFVLNNEIDGTSIGDLAPYFLEQGYHVEYGTGIMQASKIECDAVRLCTEQYYRYNQRMGLYLDYFVVESVGKRN